MKLTFAGDWPDARERAILRDVVSRVIPAGGAWCIERATGAEQVVTFDPAGPWDRAAAGTPLGLKTAREMRCPPRYIVWNTARPQLRFSCENVRIVVVQIRIWYDLGPELLEAYVLGARVPTA